MYGLVDLVELSKTWQVPLDLWWWRMLYFEVVDLDLVGLIIANFFGLIILFWQISFLRFLAFSWLLGSCPSYELF